MILKFFFCALVLASFHGLAQQENADTAASDWKFSAWAELFILPGEQDYFNPTFYVRHNKLHLEARYNYEDYNTASLWAGRRFLFGKTVKFVVVPMGAVVFGNTSGMAPGLELEIMWKKFDLYSESEHVYDFNTAENNFFYQYGELAWRPVHAFRFGGVVQRTRLFESELELQRGLFAEYYKGKFRAGLFGFSPFSDEYRYWIASVSLDF